jgi:hypothetical protein
LAVVSSSSRAAAFGQEGAFHARLLRTEQRDFTLELSAARHWSSELIRRTSAPGRLAAELLVPTTTELLREPFVIWSGTKDEGPLSARAIRSLREYLRMGGILLVDDREPSIGQFSLGARRELGRILPESAIVKLPENHVLFKTFYIIDQPVGRVEGPGFVEAIVRGNTAQVLFLKNDLLGALARRDGTWAFPMMNGDSHSREMAIRFAINISMYVLCSDYKDDQVHAPFLMRRRHQRRK